MNIILLEEHELGRNLSRWDERTKHLLKVLRKKQGDEFEAGITGGLRGTGKIEKINIDGSVFVTVQADKQPPSKLKIRAGVSFARPIQLRRIFRDLSSIGVNAIDVFGTDLAEKSYKDTKLIKDGGAREALIEGAVQARDTVLPHLSVFASLDSWLNERTWEKTNARNHLLIAADNVRPEGSLFHITPTSRPSVIAVGPERGWSDRERDILERAGFSRLSMGNRPLRTETACIASVILAMDKTEENL